jgi:GNAT superfamily N-acetyltransferase
VTAHRVDTRPVGAAELPDLATLFAGERNTAHCWCMAFCTTRSQFAAGWFTGGNRRRFESMAITSAEPMGILASIAGRPAGWCACGPRSRYVGGGRSAILTDRDPTEDDVVWLLPCLFVTSAHRGTGLTSALVQAGIELARERGAKAVEGWPYTGLDRRGADAFVGHRRLFEELGFECVAQPRPDRAIMRRAFDTG